MSGSNVFYFTTTDASGFYPTALWVSDGTPGGTRLVESFASGTTITPIESVFGGFLFAASAGGTTNFYGTFGTQLSTHQLLSAQFPSIPGNVLTNNVAFLSATEVVGGFVYATGPTAGAVTIGMADLTNQNPTLVTTLRQNSTGIESVGDFTAIGGVAYFVESNTTGVSKLYRTDGTAANTVSLASTPGSIGNLVLETSATASGTRVFLSEGTTTTPATSQGELLAIGATDASLAAPIYDFGIGTSVVSITNAANTLFIIVKNADASYSLYSSDGSNETPVLVGGVPHGTTPPTQILADGDGSARIFFQLGNQILLASAAEATVLDTFTSVGTMYVSGGTLYFGASTGAGTQLWSSDGTPGGTSQLAVINSSGNANPTNFGMLNGTLYFSANDGTHGAELWSWNGTSANLVTDLAPGALGSNPAGITAGYVAPASGTALGLVSFQGFTSAFGTFLGVSDGTFAGTGQGIMGVGLAPGVITIGLGGLSTAPTLTISHGTPDTTITEALAPPTASGLYYGPLSATSTGDFFFEQTPGPTTASVAETLYYIGNNALKPVNLGSFAPVVTGGTTDITDRVAAGATEYFLVERGDASDANRVTQLWSSDGTTGNTVQIANLGTFADAGSGVYTYPISNNAVATATGWGALLTDNGGTHAVSLFASTGVVGNSRQITLGSIDVSGTIDNTGYASLGLAGTKYVFSVTNAGTIEAIATDGTVGGTAIVTQETPASGQVYGDFTVAGNDVYFDDGVGGALYVTDGTSAGTHQLLGAGAYIGFTPPSTGIGATSVATPTTASVTQGGTTYFYFTALQGGQTGLYYSDGTTVHTVMASGLAQNAYLTASGGNIWFAADAGGGYITLFETAPGSATAAPVINPALYPAGSLLASVYGAPQNVSNIQAAVAPAGTADTFFLTPGADTVAGGPGDTAIYAAPGNLNAGDSIDGGAGINDLYLSGTGTFDLSAPTRLNNITQVLASGSNDHIILRAGTSLTVKVALGYYSGDNLNATITGAANADTIIGSGNDTVIVGSSLETVTGAGRALLTAATVGGLVSANTIEIAGGGVVTLGTNDSPQSAVKLDAATNVTLDLSAYDLFVQGSTATDTITLKGATGGSYSGWRVSPGGGGDTVVLAGGTGDELDLLDTAANLNGVTVQGFNFNPSANSFLAGPADVIDVTNIGFSPSVTAVFAGGTLTISNGVTSTAMALPGAPSGGGFVLAADGLGGTLASYVPQLFSLTTGVDSVLGTISNQIDATDAALSAGDSIDGGARSTNTLSSVLQLIGAGTFDMSLPATLTGLSAIKGDTTSGTLAVSQTIHLRNGLDAPVTLGAGHDIVFGAMNAATITSVAENLTGGGDSVFLGSGRETVRLSGVAADTIHVTAATGLAAISDSLQGSGLPTGTEDVDGGGLVPIGNISVTTLQLTAPTHMILTGTVTGPIVGSTGADTIDVTDAGAGSFGGSMTVKPNGGGDTIIVPINNSLLIQGTQAQLNNTTIDGFNFLPAQTVEFGLLTPTVIDITDLAPTGVTTAFNAGTLSVIKGSATLDTFVLPLPGTGSFTPATDGLGTGTQLTFTASGSATLQNTTLTAGTTAYVGSAGNDTLTVAAGALAPGQTLDGMGGDNVLAFPDNATFDLTTPAVLRDFTVLQPGTGDTITLRPGLPVQIDGYNGRNTIIGANAPDPIVLGKGEGGDTVVLNNPGATFIDGAFGASTISVSAASIGATITGAIFGKDTLLVTGGGGMSMGSNIRDIAAVNLTESGAVLFANSIPNLAINLSGDAHATGGARDIVVAGSGGDMITDASTGGNIIGAGAGNDIISIGSRSTFSQPAGDTVYGFDVAGSDTLEFPGTGSISYVYSGGTLTVGTGASATSIVLNGTYTGTFTPVYDSAIGGADVTYAGPVTGAIAAPCFAEGTRILTTSGEVPVETLRVGDRVPVLLGERHARVIWRGHRRVDVRRHPRPLDVQPVRVRAGAFAPGLPHRDLVLSPDHALFIDGVLVPVRVLVNGATVARLDVAAVTYWHVELEQHDILLAEGLAVESFLDTGNRGAFDDRVVDLQPEFCNPVRESRAGAALTLTGPEVDAARARLAARADAAQACDEDHFGREQEIIVSIV